LTGTAQTLVGQAPAAVTPTPLPPLGNDVAQPGTFDILLPVRVNYDAMRDKIMQAVAASKAGPFVKEMQIYPSSGKLVIGVRVAKSRRYRSGRRRMALFVQRAECRSRSAIDPDLQSGGGQFVA
jgi:hypothetical protein